MAGAERLGLTAELADLIGGLEETTTDVLRQAVVDAAAESGMELSEAELAGIVAELQAVEQGSVEPVEAVPVEPVEPATNAPDAV